MPHFSRSLREVGIFADTTSPLNQLAVGLDVALCIGMILANKNYFAELDALQRRQVANLFLTLPQLLGGPSFAHFVSSPTTSFTSCLGTTCKGCRGT